MSASWDHMMDEPAPRKDEKPTGSSTITSRYVTCSKRKRRSSDLSDDEEFIVSSTQLSPVDVRTACVAPKDYSSIKKAQLDQLKSGLDSDFKIVCGGHTWKVHSSVLAPRWEHFRAIFDLQECDGVVNLPYGDFAAINDMLRFLYTLNPFSCRCMRANPRGYLSTKYMQQQWHLAEVADKYELNVLRTVVLHVIQSNIRSSMSRRVHAIMVRAVYADDAPLAFQKLRLPLVGNMIESHGSTRFEGSREELEKEFPDFATDILEERFRRLG